MKSRLRHRIFGIALQQLQPVAKCMVLSKYALNLQRFDKMRDKSKKADSDFWINPNA